MEAKYLTPELIQKLERLMEEGMASLPREVCEITDAMDNAMGVGEAEKKGAMDRGLVKASHWLTVSLHAGGVIKPEDFEYARKKMRGEAGPIKPFRSPYPEMN